MWQEGTILRDVMRKGSTEVVNPECEEEKRSRWHQKYKWRRWYVSGGIQVTYSRQWKSKVRQVSFQKPHTSYLCMVFVFISRKGNYQADGHYFFGILYSPPVSWAILRAMLIFLIYYTWNSIYFEKCGFVAAMFLTCWFPFLSPFG